MSWFIFLLAKTKCVTLLLSHSFTSPYVYLTHDPTFRNKQAFVTEAITGCQLSCHSRLCARSLHNWGAGCVSSKSVLAVRPSWCTTAQHTSGYWVLCTCVHGLLGPPKSSYPKVQYPVTPKYIVQLSSTLSCSTIYLSRPSWLLAFQKSNEHVKCSNINLPWSSWPPGTRRDWQWRTGDQQAWVSAARVTHTHPSSLRPAAKCAKKTSTSPSQRDMGEINCCYQLIKALSDWLSAKWSQWEALP